MKLKNLTIKKVILTFGILFCLGVGTILGINFYVKASCADRIIRPEQAAELTDVDCILVLGCLVHENGQPSDMLADRLRRGIELYHAGAAPKILMSGDHAQEEYNEVGPMKKAAVDAGVPSEDVFMDHVGLSTYDSVYRAKEIYGVDKMIIVTQSYHLNRALHIAKSLGVEAYGVASDYHKYAGQIIWSTREILGRNKDFVTSIFKPVPPYMGDPVSLTGSGDLTNEKAVY